MILIDDDSFLEECGMDALCFARALLVGFKLSCLGMFNAIWLMPLYYLAEESDETNYIDDHIVELSISHVANQSPLLISPIGKPRCPTRILRDSNHETPCAHRLIKIHSVISPLPLIYGGLAS